MQKKFISNQEFAKHYSSVIQDQLDRGFIEEVFESSPKMKQCHYLAHHGVFKESRTTPVRVVLDCSAKESNRSLSLNDLLYKGPSLISELAQNLLRFRLDKYAAVSDIENAFLVVLLDDQGRNYTRFLWFDKPGECNSRLRIFRF